MSRLKAIVEKSKARLVGMEQQWAQHKDQMDTEYQVCDGCVCVCVCWM